MFKNLIFVLLLIIPFGLMAQFLSTSDSKFTYDIPRAKAVGDTVSEKKIGTHHTWVKKFVLKKIDRKGYYIYKSISSSSSYVKIKYSKSGRLKHQYYWYKENYNPFGWAKGFFTINYYSNGNLNSYLATGERTGVLVKYTKLNYVEQDRSKLEEEEFYCRKISGKWYILNIKVTRELAQWFEDKKTTLRMKKRYYKENGRIFDPTKICN